MDFPEMSLDNLQRTFDDAEEQLDKVTKLEESGVDVEDIKQNLQELLRVTSSAISFFNSKKHSPSGHSGQDSNSTSFDSISNFRTQEEVVEISSDSPKSQNDSVRCSYYIRDRYNLHIRVNCIILNEYAQFANLIVSTPVEEKYLPCPLYMDRGCFDQRCRFSHGIRAKRHNLLPVISFTSESVLEGSKVLLRQNKLWKLGTIKSVEKNGVYCSVNVERQLLRVLIEDLSLTDVKEKLNRGSDIWKRFVKPRDPNYVKRREPSPEFGDWEKHTRGIGMKLLKQMGYSSGKGLGKLEDGNVEPVAVTAKKKAENKPKIPRRGRYHGNQRDETPTPRVSLGSEFTRAERKILSLNDEIGRVRKDIERNVLMSLDSENLKRKMKILVDQLTDEKNRMKKVNSNIEMQKIKHNFSKFR